jgi:hypothetical protein
VAALAGERVAGGPLVTGGLVGLTTRDSDEYMEQLHFFSGRPNGQITAASTFSYSKSITSKYYCLLKISCA